MEMSLKCMVLALALLLLGCSTTLTEPPKQDLKFTKLSEVTKLKMREVKITVDEDGNIVMSAKQYENLSKNLSDIYANHKLLKEKNKFYERQMFGE